MSKLLFEVKDPNTYIYSGLDGGKEEMHRADIDDHTQEGENYKQVKIQMKNWSICQSLLCNGCACMYAYMNCVLSGLKYLQ